MYMRGLGAYYFKNGQPVTSLTVGDTMTFNVPGESAVWLDQYQNGVLQFSGPMNLPMPPYTLLPRDQGTFTASVYKLSGSGKKGDNIGTDQIQVLAAPISAGGSSAPTATGYPTFTDGGAPVFSPGAAVNSGSGRILATGISTPSAPPANYQEFAPGGVLPDLRVDEEAILAEEGGGFLNPTTFAILGVAALLLMRGIIA